jgi:signal transduction histidine kinase/CheY-like chemotaxis protein
LARAEDILRVLEQGEADAVLSKDGPSLLHPMDLIERERQVKLALEELVTTRAHELISARESKAAAEAANVAKSEFLSSMSHELRTPLNAILGFAQLLEAAQPPLTDTQTEWIHRILKAGWYLLDMINEILDLAAIESKKLSLTQESVLLIDVMRECQAMVESQAIDCSIHLHFLPFDSTWFVNADRTRLIQVLINLLSNAIKYNTEQGTVTVECTESVPGRIRISVKDSGIGLPAEKLLQLFHPFSRLGPKVGTKNGTGLGLVIAKGLVELMGSSIGVESTVGVGSEFWFELPRVVATQAPAENTLPEGLTPQVQLDEVRRVLLYVEDDQANLMLVEQIIAEYSQHIQMLSARDAKLGIALARTHLPDLILMDISLPGISGIEAMSILRNDPVTARIPIIALSANAMRSDIDKAMEAGFFRYLTKPIKINEFLTVLTDALEFVRTESLSQFPTTKPQ